MGVVYHGKYLEYLDVARTEFFREAGYSYKKLEDAGIGLVVTHVKMKFRMSAFYDEVITIECKLGKIESATVCFKYCIFSDDKLLVEATVKLIAADLIKKKAVRLPDNIFKGLKEYEMSE
jgi:acyl-CoA thioester hydrolase